MTGAPESPAAAGPGGPARAEDILAGLDPEQREVAAQPLGPMYVLAGAGTGKTRAITHRIAYGVHSGIYTPSRVLAVTFTARAAGELRTRLRGLGAPGVQARTFHAAALRQLQYFWPQAIGGPAPSVVAHKAPVVAEAAGRLGLRVDRAELRDLAAEIEWAKVSMLTSAGYQQAAARAHRRPAGYPPESMARVMESYEEVKSERGVIDFEDVLLLTVALLADHPRVAEAVRAQYRHFVVDEYQDVNLLQQTLLEHWLGDRRDICVVGDPAQTIYTFTGASPQHLLSFPQRHPDAQMVRLVRNYRSTPDIIALANRLAAAGPGAASGLQAQAEPGPTPELTVYADEEAEASGVAKAIADHVSAGGSAAQVAILYRTNAQSEALENALSAADLPYQVRGAERFFARAEVKQAMVLLRGAVRSSSATGPDLAAAVGDILTGAGWTPRAPSAPGAVRERWESLQSLVALAADLSRADRPPTPPDGESVAAPVGIADLVRELERRAADQHPPQVPGVTLASLHAAKGLEWDVVFLVGCAEGLLPISAADTAEQVAEERRLLYVGVTRARRALHLSYAAGRQRGRDRRASRYLAEMGLGSGAHQAGQQSGRREQRTGGRRSRRGPATCRTCGTLLSTAAERKTRRCSTCPPGYDEAVFESLRSWRAEQAGRQQVPAYVVFTDATLSAIAEAAPTDLDQLADLPGVGPVKLERYGSEVLQVLGGAGQSRPTQDRAGDDDADLPHRTRNEPRERHTE